MKREELEQLAESVDLENRADLMAAACNFGEAALLMGHANAIRKRHFGALDPNELRERTTAALRSKDPTPWPTEDRPMATQDDVRSDEATVLALCEALEPFAAIAAKLNPDLPDDTPVTLALGTSTIYVYALSRFRKARAAALRARTQTKDGPNHD